MSAVVSDIVTSVRRPSGGGHRWKVLGIGVAANAGFAAALAGVPATAVFMRADYRLGNAELGFALGLMGLGIAVSEVPWGLLTDRWGDRKVLLTGLAALAAWFAAMSAFLAPTASYLPGGAMLALAMLLVGILGGSVNGSSGRAVMAWFREGERGLAMSIRQTAVPAGGGLGAIILPPLAERYGFAPVYGVLALFAAVTAIFTWLWLYEPPAADTVAASATKRPRPVDTSGPLRDVQIWRLVVGMSALCVPQIAVLTFAAVFLHDFSGSSVVAISIAIGAVQGGAAVARVWSGRWTDRRRNRRPYLRVCSVLTALVFAVLSVLVLLAASGSVPLGQAILPPAILTTLIVGGVCASAWHGIAFTELATIAGASRAGTALGLGNTLVFAMYFVVPLGIPAVLSLSSWAAVWAIASVCALSAVPMFPRPDARASRGSR